MVYGVIIPALEIMETGLGTKAGQEVAPTPCRADIIISQQKRNTSGLTQNDRFLARMVKSSPIMSCYTIQRASFCLFFIFGKADHIMKPVGVRIIVRGRIAVVFSDHPFDAFHADSMQFAVPFP